VTADAEAGGGAGVKAREVNGCGRGGWDGKGELRGIGELGAFTVEIFSRKRPFWPNLREYLDSERWVGDWVGG